MIGERRVEEGIWLEKGTIWEEEVSTCGSQNAEAQYTKNGEFNEIVGPAPPLTTGNTMGRHCSMHGSVGVV
eukprot:6487587-Amphidinium_carterae.1